MGKQGPFEEEKEYLAGEREKNMIQNTWEGEMQIINLFHHALTGAQTSAFRKGFHFCLTTRMNKFEVIKDLHLFGRKLIFKKIFSQTKELRGDGGRVAPVELEARDLEMIQLLEELSGDAPESGVLDRRDCPPLTHTANPKLKSKSHLICHHGMFAHQLKYSLIWFQGTLKCLKRNLIFII
ncbi:hypothetical protein GDO81_001384 [Engystomops pustulosus]|uniref:Uncharacterized protein n=1 Tax=Engystomops pustulosus TaxID=76066 RepID=A0AAV7DC25_ENGPU|nr:hypothetical protein GDO81_001384 [Engystomops pustulosus]